MLLTVSNYHIRKNLQRFLKEKRCLKARENVKVLVEAWLKLKMNKTINW